MALSEVIPPGVCPCLILGGLGWFADGAKEAVGIHNTVILGKVTKCGVRFDGTDLLCLVTPQPRVPESSQSPVYL